MRQDFRTKSARRAPPKIARASADVFAKLVRKTKYAEPSLAENWPSIAGGEIAELCRPGRITGPRSGRTLEVSAPSGAAATALAMRLDDLLARVNRYLGPNAISRISIIQRATRAPEKPAGSQSADDDPSPLGRALASFRAAVEKRKD